MDGLSLFFPMYEEEANIERAVLSALEVAPKIAESFEVIVVDDGSRDRTAAIATELAAAHSQVRLVRHEVNRGYGQALRTGFAAARHPLVFFTDGDNQFDLRELPGFIAALGDADVLSGYRLVRRDPVHRRCYAFGYNRLARLLFGIPVRDVNCAFKVYRRSLLERLELKSTGALINVEMLARARQCGAVIREVGVHHYPREYGQQTGGNPAVIYRAFAEMFQLWRELS